MTVTPWWMLAGVATVLMAVLLADRIASHRRAKWLRRVARRRGFRYSQVDRFFLAKRIRGELAGGAEDVVVRDLMYRSERGGYTYAFTAIYRGHANGRVVMSARETSGNAGLIDINRGEPKLSIGKQYRRLLQAAGPS